MSHNPQRLLSESENPEGLHKRYIVTKANGEPVDPNAIYFVLRLDGYGDDMGHISACRAAAAAYVEHAPSHLAKMAGELGSLLDEITGQ